MISFLLDQPPLPLQLAGTTARHGEPRCFLGSQEGTVLLLRELRGTQDDSMGGRRELHCLHKRQARHLLSEPALGHGVCGMAPLSLPMSTPVGPRWGVDACQPVSVSISPSGLICMLSLLLSGCNPLWCPRLICIFPFFKN